MVEPCLLYTSVLEGMIKEGRPYLGVLYAGLILRKVRCQARQDNLSFGITKTSVELDNLRTASSQNKPRVEDTKIRTVSYTHLIVLSINVSNWITAFT